MKFNRTNTIKTVNRSGHVAYSLQDKENLVSKVLTTMFNEPKYYGETEKELVELAEKMAYDNPAFLSKLTCYTRNVANLRSVSHVLTAIIARYAHSYTRATVRNVVVRPDDITEIMSCYLNMYGKPFPNALKREIAVVIQNFNEYQLAKYNGGNKALKFKDVLRIVHPKPKNAQVAALFGKVLNDSLETPYTWETELSAKGNTKEVWNELIASNKVGYMALLRNLSNIIKSGAYIDPVLHKLSNPEEVKRSRQLPFRFYSAYHTLKQRGMMTPAIHAALESAICTSIDNMDTLPGRTLIAVDCSGSMGAPVSGNSDVLCANIAALMGAMSARMCESATVCYFSSSVNWWRKANYPGYEIVNYGKYDSVLDTADSRKDAGGGTDLTLPLKWALEEDGALKPFDRVIYFSDNETNDGIERSCQGLVEKYRKTKNKDFWVHGVDLEGYGTTQFYGNKVNLIAGWDETVLSYISQVENGMDSLVEAIDAYEVK